MSGSVSRGVDDSAVISCERNVAISNVACGGRLDVKLCRCPYRCPDLHVVHIPVVNPLGVLAMSAESDAEEVRRKKVGERILECCPLETAILIVECLNLLPCIATVRRYLCREIVDVGLLAVAQLQIEAQPCVGAVCGVELTCHERLVVVLECGPAVCSRRVDESVLIIVDRPF